MKLQVGIIGNSIKHSLSPIIQNLALKTHNINANYEIWDTPIPELKNRIDLLKQDNVLGANVTIPYKEQVIPWLDSLSDEVKTIGAVNTISVILGPAFVGVLYGRYEGFNTLKSGISQLAKNELPLYEIISGAALAFAALLLILPGFATDFIGLLLIFPITRKFFFKSMSKKYSSNKKNIKKNFIEGEYEDIDEDK